MAVADALRVEVAWVGDGGGSRIALEVPRGTTVRGAIERSRIQSRHPEIDLARHAVGVCGERCALDAPLADGVRVEIYRPLRRDPKEARRSRAAR
jgi:putative ubiquitin-RnfH superfamily antitoxin RatB of RatAB toxin-antitoxin module